MVNRGSTENIVSFRPSQPSQTGREISKVRRPLAPNVRRRRWVWLIVMVLFFLWSGTQLVVQAGELESRKAALAAEKEKLVQLKEENRDLKKDIDRLQNEEYLYELARKMGYKKPGEEILDLNGFE
ncbi:cell division protein DivIC [Melghirimyces profundicolus]|uniref:Cell division protein DivIC n=1 Tax=Melghirimyces profundicolus TaxID=1242148 RepID=A0A2T6BGR8_9BACL|nr:septum formation initiator family protein [Melghirimyces profundicolus]PTX55250.1 cell division protein DivIC [Melghirimyces profundicolus]